MNKQKDISNIVFSGSGGSSDSSKTYVEQSDTLASKQYLRIVDLISEGQIEGLVAGLQSVFLDGTPVQNKDGSENLKGWNIQGRTGSQTQPAINGFSQVESVKQVGVQVKYNAPVARAIESSDATQVRVSVSIPSLKYTNASSGETGATSVAVAVDLQSNGGAWVPVVFHREDVLSSQMAGYFSQYSSTQINGTQPLINPILCVKYRNLPNTNRQHISYDVKRSVHGAENWITVDTGVFDVSCFEMAQNYYGGPGQAPSYIGYHVVEKDYLLFHSIESDSSITYDYKIEVTGQSNSGALSLDLSQSKGKIEFPYDWISGKSSDAFVKDYLVNLTGGAPYNIRVRRPVADSTSQLLENDTYFGSYTEIIPYKYRYPNSAIMALSVDGSQYSSIPSREYEVKGIRCKIPSTYNPVTRTYSGIWNGSSWYVAWTDNPVWILYDLLTNTRYGLGNKIKPSQIDVAKFYEISQYCDELVDNGFGGKEPRYTCSLYLQGKTKAMQVLADIASVFQGYLYWAGGKLTANYDHPSDPVWLFNNSNVIDGKFTYEGTDKATRYTTVLVTYTDRLDNYTQKVEYVEDRDGIVRWGQNTLETTAIGCMSRGQAHRLGKNILLSNRYLTETVSFKAGIESNAACLLPGDVIQVSDSLRAGKRLGGRVLSATTSTVSLDSKVAIEAGKSYTLHVINPSGDVLSSAVTNTVGETSSLSVTLTTAPQAMSVWILESNSVQAQLFRIISIKESEATLYDISAVAYNPSKYSAIESDISFIPLQISGTSSTSIEAPENVRLSEELYFDAAKTLLTKLNIIVKPSQNPYFSYFKGLWRNNTLGTSWAAIPSFTDLEISIEGMREGEIEVALQAVNALGVVSPTTYQTYTIKGKSVPPSDVTGFCASVTKGVAYLTWDAFTSNLDIDVEYFVIKHSVGTNPSWYNGVVVTSKIPAPSTSAVVPAIAGAYLIKAVDSSGNFSRNPAIVLNEVSNLEHYNVVEAISEHPTWSGIKDRTQVVDGELRLTLEKSMSEWNPLSSTVPLSVLGVGTIEGNYITSVHDLGSVYSCRLTFLANVYGYSKYNVMGGWVSLNSVSSLAGGTSDQYSVDILYRVSNDNITWSQWNNTLSGEVVGRYFQFRLWMRSFYTNTTPSVSKFDIVIDMQDRVDGNENVVCSASGTTILYNPPFFSNPAVAIVSQGMSTGDYYTITAKSNQGFTIRYFNSSGTGVQRTFDWVAKGYGFKY